MTYGEATPHELHLLEPDRVPRDLDLKSATRAAALLAATRDLIHDTPHTPDQTDQLDQESCLFSCWSKWSKRSKQISKVFNDKCAHHTGTHTCLGSPAGHDVQRTWETQTIPGSLVLPHSPMHAFL